MSRCSTSQPFSPVQLQQTTPSPAYLQHGGNGGQGVRRHRPTGRRQREEVAQEQLLPDELAVVIGQQRRALTRLGAIGGGATRTCRGKEEGVGSIQRVC